MKRQAGRAFMVVEAASWVVAVLALVWIVVWHDVWIEAYWRERSDRGQLFFGQPQFRLGRKPPADRTKLHPTWLSIMRYEADLSVGLLAASAGMTLVNAARFYRIRRVWREPGAVACIVAVAAMGVCVLEEASMALKGRKGLWHYDPFPNAWPVYELHISLAVLGAWVVIAAMSRWRCRRDWTDRAGVVIGFLWLVVMLYRLFASLFIPFGNWRY